jgi:hypothetical protein
MVYSARIKRKWIMKDYVFANGAALNLNMIMRRVLPSVI